MVLILILEGVTFEKLPSCSEESLAFGLLDILMLSKMMGIFKVRLNQFRIMIWLQAHRRWQRKKCGGLKEIVPHRLTHIDTWLQMVELFGKD